MASLGNDLADIRKEQGLSIDDIQNMTKLAPEILRSIEDDSIFAQRGLDDIYIRNYVRTYAKAVKVNEPEIIRALNQVSAGKYDGSLGTSRTEASAVGMNNSENSDMVHDHSPKYASEQSTGQTSQHSKQIKTSFAADNSSSINWVEVGKKAQPVKGNARISTALLIVLLFAGIVGTAVLFYSLFNNNSSDSNTASNATDPQETVQQPLVPADTLQESLLSEENKIQSVFAAQPLPDTLSITIVAASGKLAPVYVNTDMGIKRPYWIELHDTMRFEFVDTIRVQTNRQYEHMKLIFNGHQIENYYQQFYNPDISMVELNREIIENHPAWRIPPQNTTTPSVDNS